MATGTLAEKYDAVIVGGGVFGARLALLLARPPFDAKVLLLERESRLLARASLLNQARIHGGYHYPRSVLTSLRSRVNYERFVVDFGTCIVKDVTHVYAVARGSRVTATQFSTFCLRIGAGVSVAPPEVTSLFDENRIEQVFEVSESVMDAALLRGILEKDLAAAGVEVRLGQEVTELMPHDRSSGIAIRTAAAQYSARIVLNCTYSRLNAVLAASKLDTVPLRHELAELAVIDLPGDLRGLAITVIDGPYFSLLPYPPRNAWSMSHVRYTPHRSWQSGSDAEEGAQMEAARTSLFEHMRHDAERYVPSMKDARYLGSTWETKTVMPRSEGDDSRPILVRPSMRLPGLVSVLGAKIDNVYDAEDAVREWLLTSNGLSRTPS